MARRDLSGRQEGLSNAPVLVTINHGSTAGTARPDATTAPVVLWLGTVTPTNAIDGDLFLNLS